MSFTKVAPAGIGTEPGTSIRIGDSLLHSTGIDLGSGTGIGASITRHGDATFTGIITASAFFGDGSGLEGVSSSGIGTPLSDDDTSELNKVYYVNQELSIGSTVTVNHPDSAIASYTHYQDLVVTNDADFIVADGDTFIPDVLGINTASLPNPVSGATGGRIRAGTITNAGANGAVNFPNGLTGTAGTFTGNLNVGGTLTYEDVTNVDSVGIVTAGTGLVVGSTSRSSTNVHIKSSTTGQGEIRFADDVINAGYIKYLHSDNALLFATNTLERVRIDSNGNLEIKGSGEGGPKVFRDGGNGPDIVLHGSRGTIASPTASAGTDLLGNINFAGYDGSGYHRRASINGIIDGTVSSNTVPTAIQFRTGTTTPVERLRISSSGIVTKPYQVAWAMHGNGAQNLTGGTRLNFNVNGTGFGSFSNRNHSGVDTTNNSFTVPVTGLYSITVTVFCYTDNNNNTFSLVPFKNGTAMNNGNDTIFILGASATNANVTYSGTILLQLNANDEIDIRRRTGETGTSRVYLPHSHFSGFLVG